MPVVSYCFVARILYTYKMQEKLSNFTVFVLPEFIFLNMHTLIFNVFFIIFIKNLYSLNFFHFSFCV